MATALLFQISVKCEQGFNLNQIWICETMCAVMIDVKQMILRNIQKITENNFKSLQFLYNSLQSEKIFFFCCWPPKVA